MRSTFAEGINGTELTRTARENVCKNIGVRCTFVRIDVFKTSLSDDEVEHLGTVEEETRRFFLQRSLCEGVTLVEDDDDDDEIEEDKLLFIVSISDSTCRNVRSQLMDVIGLMYQFNTLMIIQ
jgi:hypothetical protein